MSATMQAQAVLDKPKAVRGVLKYDEAIKYLETKYDFDQYNYSKHDGRDYDRWCDAKGYTERKKDPQGKHRSSSQIWFTEYRKDPNGMAKEPPKENFWHWMLSIIGIDAVKTTKPFVLPVGRLLDIYDAELAPLLQKHYDKNYETMVALIKEQVSDPDLQFAALQDYPRMDAKIPAYARQVLNYMREEFGEVLKMRVPNRG